MLVVDNSTTRRLVVDYFAYAARLGVSARRAAHLLSSTTPPRAGSSSTTSPPPRVRVPRHVAWLVTRLVAPLVVDYSASRRLVVDYFASAARPGASARRAAHHADRRTARHQLLRLRRSSRCLGTSRGSSLVVDYFAYATRPGASSRRAVHRLSSTTSLTLHDRVPWHVAWLVVDYFAYAARLGASARRAAHLLSSTTSPTPRDRVPQHVARFIACRRLLRRRCTTGCLGTSHGSLLTVNNCIKVRL
jgi:hypothetical protein